MIILTELEWGNCFSYAEDNKLNLTANPITQLVGANGAGKTSIPLLIQEVLFGKNIRGIKKVDISNRYTDIPGYWINLKFEKYDDMYQIKLNRSKSKLTLSLMENGVDISSHTAVATYKSIAEIIGFSDFKMVSQLLYQSSTTNLEFLTATDTNRKKFLVSLLNLVKYLELHETFKVASKDIGKDIVAARATLEHIRAWITKHSAMDLTEKVEQTSINIPTRIIEEIIDVKSKIEHRQEINKTIVTNNTYKASLALIDIESMNNAIKKYDKEEVARVTEVMGGLKAKSNIAGSTKKKFSSLEGITDCSTCYQPVDKENIDAILSKASDELKYFTKEVSKLQKELKDWEILRKNNIVARKVETDFIRLNQLIDFGLESDTLDADELDTILRVLKKELFNVEEDSKKVIRYNNTVAAHNAKIQVIKDQLIEFKKDRDAKGRVFDLANEEKSYIEILKSAFSTNGLLSYKIESSVKVLEDSINDYLAEFCFFRLIFTLEGEKLNVNIIDDQGTSIAIESLSTGELARVNISTVLAIRKVMTALANSNINFLFLDEIVGVLDDEGKEKLTEILIKENLNTFIVSHEATHPLIPKVLVEKHNNISRLIDG